MDIEEIRLKHYQNVVKHKCTNPRNSMNYLSYKYKGNHMQVHLTKLIVKQKEKRKF